MAEVGKTYAGAIAEKINDFRDGVDKIKAWAKGYQGGNADAGKAMAFQAFSQQAGKAVVENKAVPDSLKSALYAAQEKSKEAWAFFQTGKPCEVSGGTGGNHHKTFPVADCAGYAAAIEEEMAQLEQIRAVMSCDCGLIRQIIEMSNHCDELSVRLERMRELNQTPEKIYTQFNKPSFGLNSWQSRYVKLGGVCYEVRLTPTFELGMLDIDLKRFKTEEANQTIIIQDEAEKTVLEIKVLTGDWAKFVAYLGFIRKTPPGGIGGTGPGSSTEGKYITGKKLKSIFPGTSQRRCDEVAALINKYAEEYGLTTKERLAHFIGQIGAESNLLDLKELYKYSSKARIKEIFGKVKYCDLFEGYEADLSKCNGSKPMGCTPPLREITPNLVIKNKYLNSKLLFDYTYSCRMDNGPTTTGDGSRFRGRAFMHLTGRDKYTALQRNWNATFPNDQKDFLCDSDACEANRELLVTDLDFAMKSSLAFWKTAKANDLANTVNKDNIEKVSLIINGGPNGKEKRISLTKNTYNILKK